MKRSLAFGGVVAAALAVTLVVLSAGVSAQDVNAVRVVARFPHDSGAFTQGLDFAGQKLFEGTGLYGESTLRRVDLASGEVRRKVALDKSFFGEGITVLGKKIYQLTWKENVAFVYRKKTFKRIKRFSYEGQGWGLTNNGRSLIMSDGSAQLFWRNPETFAVTRKITVKNGTDEISGLNELEWVEGSILANVFPTNEIVRIDPGTGAVTRRYDLSAIKGREDGAAADVTNGIAYLASEKRLFVTGKRWSNIYEIKLPASP